MESSVDLVAEQVVETWRIHARIQRLILDSVPDGALLATTQIKGRTVGEQFAHIHNVRLMWLKSAGAESAAAVPKLDKAAAASRPDLQRALDLSAAAIEQLLSDALARGRVKGFKPHPVAFVGYLISHESYHQGDIGVRLTASGHRLDQKVAYAMWEWGSR